MSFRVSISTADGERVNSLFLEVDLDNETFEKHFKVIEHESFKTGNEYVGLDGGEIPLQSLQVVDDSFIEVIKPGITQFEQYLKSEFGNSISFLYLVYERTNLLSNLKVRQDTNQDSN